MTPGRPRRALGVVSGLPRPVPLFSFLYEGPAGHTWWSRVYEVRCDMPVSPQADEVAWHAFLTEDELERRLPEWEWVPDGLEAYRRLCAGPRPAMTAEDVAIPGPGEGSGNARKGIT